MVHVREPIRFRNTLDLCLNPDEDSNLNFEVKSNFSRSDHPYITLDTNLPIRIEQSRRTYRDFKYVDYELLNAHLAIIDWVSHFNGYDNYCDVLYTFFSLLLTN